MANPAKRGRSNLPKEAAKLRYIEMGELVAVEQLRKDAQTLDETSMPIGPFMRLEAEAVAARDGKTRGAITNLFGSQATFQAETMALALSAGDWIERVAYPLPADYPDADAWIDALFAGQSARGPQHGAKPKLNYAFLWILWLSVVPYGLWSKAIAQPSVAEYAQWLSALERLYQQALEHFGLELQEDVTLNDLACATGSLIEGVWLNQCLSTRHPSDAAKPIDTVLRRSGRLLWRGATRKRRVR